MKKIFEYAGVFFGFSALLFSFVMIVRAVFGDVALVLRCSDKTEAVVAEYKITVTTDDDGDKVKHYYPVYSYKYDNVNYKSVSAFSDSSFHSAKEGTSLVIHINPDNPKEVYGSVNASFFISIAFIALPVIFVVYLFVLRKKNKKRKKETLD